MNENKDTETNRKESTFSRFGAERIVSWWEKHKKIDCWTFTFRIKIPKYKLFKKILIVLFMLPACFVIPPFTFVMKRWWGKRQDSYRKRMTMKELEKDNSLKGNLVLFWEYLRE